MITVSIDYDPSIRGTRIWVVDERQDGIYAFSRSDLKLKKVEPCEELEPTFVFNRRDGDDFLRELSNALVKAGYKPDELKANNQQVVAIKYHLEDMRKLVFEEKK